MAAGDFSASALMAVQVKAEQMWAEGQFAQEYDPQAETAKAVLENQTAKFTPLDNPEKDNSMKVTWLNACNIVDEDCTPSCDIEAEELQSASMNVAPDTCRSASFKIDREKIRTGTYELEEQAALGLMTCVKTLDEFWNTQMVAKLKTFAGTNRFPSPYSFASGTTTVPAANYNRKMVADLMKQAKMNLFKGFYLIDDGELFTDWMNANFDQGNDTGKGDAARIGAVKMYFDLFGFAAAGITEDTFMVAPSAVALKTVNRYGNTPVVMGGKIGETLYTVPSKVLPGVRYDVRYQQTCEVVDGKQRYFDKWEFKTNGLIVKNPNGCSGTTGVLSYTKGA